MSRAVRTLLFSTLYPSSERPGHGVFVQSRLCELLTYGGIQTRVVAPVPWFPSTDPRHHEHAAIARTPRREQRHGVDVLHPRYLVIPKFGMTVAPVLLALGARSAVQSVLNEGFDFDLFDAHYYYPDGVAAALLARWFKRPFVVTARGSDVNVIANYRAPRRMIRWAAGQAAASICVSASLAERLLMLGAPADRITVLRNGVDADRFRPEVPAVARARLGLAGSPLLLSVGNLLEVKRHHLVIDALAYLRQSRPAAQLAIVGGGAMRNTLEAHAKAAGVREAVTFAGVVAQEELRWWYSAADLLVLASRSEGWPNVLLEAMACGTPVLASRVGGVAEIVTTPSVGEVIDISDGLELRDAILNLIDRGLDRDVVRGYALQMDWDTTSQGQLALFGRVIADRSAACRDTGVRAG